MAKQGEGDPRWVVSEREDGRNVNSWHWEDKDVSAWAKARIKELLSPSVCAAVEDGVFVTVESVESVDGDATLYNRKGGLKVLYDLKVTGRWTTDHSDKDMRTHGEFKFELFDEEPDVLVMVDPQSKGEHKYRSTFADRVSPTIRSQCGIFVKEMHAGAGQSLNGMTVPDKKQTSETKVTDFLRSGMSQAERPAKKKASTSALVLKDVFTCSTSDIYLALTDSARLEAITRARALSEAKEGGKVNLLNGTVRGSYTKLVVGEEVRMKWKLKTWGEEAGEGEVSVRIGAEEDGKTGLEVIIEGVPDGERSSTEGFWRVQIFQAIKVVMGWGSASQFL